MSDTATDPPLVLDPSEAWLAAYALGLAYAEKTDAQRLSELLDAIQGHPELLEAAHRRLHGADVVEPGIGDEALRLLARAMVRTGCRAPHPLSR